MKEQTKKSHISGIMVLLLFGGFMVSVLLVLLTGADVYQRMAQRGQDSYDQRTAAQYIATRVRQADQAGMVSVRDFAGQDALVLTQEYDGFPYETLVYCYGGYLRELFAGAGSEQDPEYGEPILAAETLQIMDKDSCLQVELQLPEGKEETLILHLRSGEGGLS